MLPSLRIQQLLLQLSILILILLAAHLHSWTVIELQHADKLPASNNEAYQLSFAPTAYCLRFGNGSSDCHSFFDALLENSSQSDNWSSASHSQRSQEVVVTQAVSCWCHTRQEISWYMQGARHLACLVVLETARYTLALWGFFAIMNLGFSLLVFPQSRIGCHAFSSFTSALLGFLVTLVWCYYSDIYVDKEYLVELSLKWHHGASYHCALVAFALAAANARIAFDATGHARSRIFSPRVVQPTSRIAHLDNWDPLLCPANYLV